MLMMATSRRAVATPSTSVPDRARTWRTVLIALLPTLLTVGWEWIQGDAPSNPVRFAAGVPLGAVVSWIVLRAN
jgi:hypothetical protein